MILKAIKYPIGLLLCSMTVLLPGQQYNFIRYSVQEGMPQSQVFAAMEDVEGYIWYGTQGGGIARFDGVEFDVFTMKDGLPSNYISDIIQDEKRRIWVGTNRGLGMFDGRKWQVFHSETKNDLDIHSLFLKNDSTIWLGTGRGIYAFSTERKILKKQTLDPRLDKLGVNDFLQGKHGVWVASNSGVWLAGKSVKRYTARDGLSGSVVQAFLRDTTGLLWMASYDGGVSILDENKLQFLPFHSDDKAKKAMAIYMDEKRNVWVGTRDKGIVVFHPQDSTWRVINESKGLPHNHIRKIFCDSWHNTWICTSGGGVAKYLGQFFVQYTAGSGLHGKYIYALAEGQDGLLRISASNNGVAVFDGHSFQKMKADSGYIDVKSKALLSTPEGLWVGTEGKGLVLMDSSGYRVFTEKEGLTSNWIRSLEQDDDGNIWAATYAKGIVEIIKSHNGKYRIIRHKTDLPALYMSCLRKSPNGEIWFATKYGELGKIVDGKVDKVYNQRDGLPGIFIRSICFDSIGNIWLGTAGKGIYVANAGELPIDFQPLSADKPLFSSNIYSMVFDEKGDLWVGSEAGVDKIDLNETGAVLDVRHFGRNEGFLGIETCQNAALLDKNSNLWFGTMNGLMKHRPSADLKITSIPKIHFEQISLFYKPLVDTQFGTYVNTDGSLKPGLRLPHNRNHLNFAFKAINLVNPKDIQYRWRLRGIESDWSPLSTRESVDYSNLAPGDYTFDVQAVSDGENLSKIISTSFSIEQPFWQWWWVQLSAIAVLFLVAFIWFWFWKKKLERKERAKREQLEMKNHVLQLEQKALQLQMNPHFIFNALNSIQSLVATKDYKTARTQINNFATLMRGILSNSKQQKISIEEEIYVLEKYLDMEQFCQRVPFDFEIVREEGLEVADIEIPPMILQPFVENAVIHGIAHRKEKGHIKIEFAIENNDILVCTITDNGVGRYRAESLKQSRKPGHQSIAMEVTRERLEALRKAADKDYAPLIVEDILSEEHGVVGTKVVVRFAVYSSI